MEQTVLTQNNTSETPKKAKTLRVLAMIFLGIYAILAFVMTFGHHDIPNFNIYRELFFILGFLCLLPIGSNRGIKIAILTMVLCDIACVLYDELVIVDLNNYLLRSSIRAAQCLIIIYIYSLFILNSNIELNNKRWINLTFIMMMMGIILIISDGVIYMPEYEKVMHDTQLRNITYKTMFFSTIGNRILDMIRPILWFVVYYKLCFSSLFCGIYDKEARPVLNPFNKQVIGAIIVAAVTCGLLWLVFINRDIILEFFL